MKIVADTNILVSAGLWGHGQPRQILELAIEGKLKIGVSSALYDEFCGVLTFHKLKTRMRKERVTIRDVKSHVSPFLTFIRRTSAPPSVCKDPTDNEVLGCAVDFKADCLISGDADILESGENFQGIPIMTVTNFLKKYFPDRLTTR